MTGGFLLSAPPSPNSCAGSGLLSATGGNSLSADARLQDCTGSGLLSAIEAERQAKKITKRDLCRSAKVGISYYRDILLGLYNPSEALLRRLRRALERPAETHADNIRAQLIEQTWRRALDGIAAHYEVSADDVVASRAQKQATGNEKWLRCARAHQAALHLVRHVTGLPQADIARHFGVTRPALSQAMSAVEDRRAQEPALETLLTNLERRMA